MYQLSENIFLYLMLLLLRRDVLTEDVEGGAHLLFCNWVVEWQVKWMGAMETWWWMGEWGAYRAIRKGCRRAFVNGMLHSLLPLPDSRVWQLQWMAKGTHAESSHGQISVSVLKLLLLVNHRGIFIVSVNWLKVAISASLVYPSGFSRTTTQ